MRLEGWEERLDAYFRDVVARPFAYGICDCVTFVSDAVLIMTGVDPILEGRGKYATLRDGLALLAKHRDGYEQIIGFYFDEWSNARQARRGDVVLAEFNGEKTFGIVWNGMGWFKGESGIVSLRLNACLKAWKID